MKSPYSWCVKGQNSVEDAVGKLATAILFVMMVILTVNSVLRYFFASPLTGVIQFTELYLMVGAIFLYFPVLQREDGNVSVNMFMRRFGDTTNRVRDLCYLLVVLIIFLSLSRAFFDKALDLTIRGATLQGLGYPVYISWWLAFAGTFLLSTRIVIQIINIVIGFWGQHD